MSCKYHTYKCVYIYIHMYCISQVLCVIFLKGSIVPLFKRICSTSPKECRAMGIPGSQEVVSPNAFFPEKAHGKWVKHPPIIKKLDQLQ